MIGISLVTAAAIVLIALKNCSRSGSRARDPIVLSGVAAVENRPPDRASIPPCEAPLSHRRRFDNVLVEDATLLHGWKISLLYSIAYCNPWSYDPVLFVQHNSEKKAAGCFWRQSFIAWGDGLGNCSGNDGGGHPDVVPFGSFA